MPRISWPSLLIGAALALFVLPFATRLVQGGGQG